MKKPKLIQAVLITISIAILLGLFVKMQTIQPQDIDYDSDPYSKIQYIDDIRKVINTIKGGSEKKIASLVKYPLAMSYPVPDINNEEEFIERFDEVFDEAILEKIASSSIDDWNTVGWRGIMFDLGMVWLDYDGFIKGINYETSIAKKIQKDLNSDIVMVMDECPKKSNDYNLIKESMDLSLYWANRSKKTFGKNPHKALFGIIQGGVYEDLRLESAEFTVSQPYFGYAVGGCLGSDSFELQDVISMSMRTLNKNQLVPHPIHLLGIGGIADIWDGVAKGIDTFDCVSPTRLARHGSALIKGKQGKKNIKNTKFSNDFSPIDNTCSCSTCKSYSLAYLHHLFKINEILGLRIATEHNLKFYMDLMGLIRQEIKLNSFEKWASQFLKRYNNE